MREPGSKASFRGREVKSFDSDMLSLRSLLDIIVEMSSRKKTKESRVLEKGQGWTWRLSIRGISILFKNMEPDDVI